MTITYKRLGSGSYEVYQEGEYIALIDRTGEGDGWLDTWWWESADPSVTGLMTASSLRELKEAGEAWLGRLALAN